MPPCRFTPPWDIEDNGACFIIPDNNGQALSYVYYENEPGRRTEARPSSWRNSRNCSALRRGRKRIRLFTGGRLNRRVVRKWSAKLQFGFYEPWSPWDCANASRWQMRRSEASPVRLDWTNSMPLISTRENKAGSSNLGRLSRRCSLQPVGGPRGANSLPGAAYCAETCRKFGLVRRTTCKLCS